jgi:hypothetical protein
MAAIFRKIGLKTYLVLRPGHCFLAVDQTFEGHEKVGIETTMIGSGADFSSACRKGSQELDDVEGKIRAKQPGFELVDIQKARQMGIQPLKQVHDINLADLIQKQSTSGEPVDK